MPNYVWYSQQHSSGYLVGEKILGPGIGRYARILASEILRQCHICCISFEMPHINTYESRLLSDIQHKPWSSQTPEAVHHHQYNWLQKSLFEQKPLRSVLRRFTTSTTYNRRTDEMFTWICTPYTAKVITFIQCPSLYDNCQQEHFIESAFS